MKRGAFYSESSGDLSTPITPSCCYCTSENREVCDECGDWWKHQWLDQERRLEKKRAKMSELREDVSDLEAQIAELKDDLVLSADTIKDLDQELKDTQKEAQAETQELYRLHTCNECVL